jgi:hypothetical protein
MHHWATPHPKNPVLDNIVSMARKMQIGAGPVSASLAASLPAGWK